MVTWNDAGLAVTQVEFVDGREGERIRAAGTWRYDGAGALRVTATHVFLDTLLTAFAQPTRYGGVMDLDATISGTREHPRVKATLTVASGRVERVTYQQLTGRIDYTDQTLAIDMRLDQAPGSGSPPSARCRSRCSRPTDPSSRSTSRSNRARSDLGLLEGLTDVVRAVNGQLNVDVAAVARHAIHISRDGYGRERGIRCRGDRRAVQERPRGADADPRPRRRRTLHLEDSNGGRWTCMAASARTS